MSSSKMVSQLITGSVSNNAKNKSQTTKPAQPELLFNRDIDAMIDKYNNLRGQDRENWISIQNSYLSKYHPFYSLYNQTSENLKPNSKEFKEQAWDNYQYRYE